jgi:hypothetical protein
VLGRSSAEARGATNSQRREGRCYGPVDVSQRLPGELPQPLSRRVERGDVRIDRRPPISRTWGTVVLSGGVEASWLHRFDGTENASKPEGCHLSVRAVSSEDRVRQAVVMVVRTLNADDDPKQLGSARAAPGGWSTGLTGATSTRKYIYISPPATPHPGP